MELLPNLAGLIASVNQTAGPSAVRVISDQIKQAIRHEVDPYILAGVLVEGIAMTLLANVPEQQRKAVSGDVLKLIYVRFLSLGMLDKPTM
jgi:hypothetical protein